MRATTFDIFDTLITRAVGAPSTVFLLMGRLPEVASVTGVGAEAFARLRMHGEHRIRRGGEDVTLEEIYREVGHGLGLTAAEQGQLIEAELALERRLSRAVPSAAALLEASAGDRRLAISDMYLPSSFVSELLEQHGHADVFEAVHVSSDTRVMKRTGALFRQLQATAGLDPETWTHVGDDVRADHLVPQGLGITTRQVTAARLNRYERILDDFRWETGGMSSLFSGASRLARLATPAGPAGDVVVDVAAGVAAPALCAYVLWLLNNARKEGIERLYFLARDGEILFQIATRICRSLGWQIDLRYLYGSRYVFHRPGLADTDLADADWLWRSLYLLSNEQVLRRLGLDDEAVAATLLRHGLPPLERDPEIAALLSADAEVTAAVRVAAVEAQQLLRDYLIQEGLTDGVPFALVDTGWEGQMVQSMHDVLAPLGVGVERVFFLGRLQRNRGFENPEAITGYFFDERAGTGFVEATMQLRWLLEAFCAADHGMTIGFTETSTGIEPVLVSADNPALGRWPFWDIYRQATYTFAELCIWDADLIEVNADLRAPVNALLSELWFHPRDDEAAVWGQFPFDDLLASDWHPLARPIGLGDFATRAKAGYAGHRIWIPGSIQMSAPAVRPFARAGLWLKESLEDARSAGVPPLAHLRAEAVSSVGRLRARVGLVLGRSAAG